MLQAWQAACTANSWLLVPVNHGPFVLPHADSSCTGLCVKIKCSGAKAANCLLLTWVLAKIRIPEPDPKAACLQRVSLISLELILHQGRMINFNWILVIYVTSYELNIKLSSVVYSEFACSGEVIQEEYEWQGRKKKFFESCIHIFTYTNIFPIWTRAKHLSDIFRWTQNEKRKETSWETENSVLT